MATASVRDNKAQSRFELDVEGALAFANYRLTPSAVIITHTETPRALRGRGIASELVEGALQLIRADGLKGDRRLRFRGGLPAQASGVCRLGGVSSPLPEFVGRCLKCHDMTFLDVDSEASGTIRP